MNESIIYIFLFFRGKNIFCSTLKYLNLFLSFIQIYNEIATENNVPELKTDKNIYSF